MIGFGRLFHSGVDSVSLNGAMRIGGATSGTGGGVMPVAFAMTSRKTWNFGVGRPLSSSAAS